MWQQYIDDSYLIFYQLKYNFFYLWFEKHALISKVAANSWNGTTERKKIMIRWPFLKVKPQVQRFVYWTHNQLFHTSESFIKHRLRSCKLITPNIQLLVVWIWNEESLHWFIELIIKTDTHQDSIVSKMEGSLASVRVENGCCALCRLLDQKKTNDCQRK